MKLKKDTKRHVLHMNKTTTTVQHSRETDDKSIINSLFLEDDILSKYNYLSNIWSSATKKSII